MLVVEALHMPEDNVYNTLLVPHGANAGLKLHTDQYGSPPFDEHSGQAI